MNRFKSFESFKLYEFEGKSNMSSPRQISFMDDLYQRIKKEILPIIPEQYKADYDRGIEIVIHTDNKKDMSVGVKIVGDKMDVYVNPISGPKFDVNFEFNPYKADYVINTFREEFEKSESNGIFTGEEGKFKNFYDDYTDDDDDNPEDNQEDIDTPITEKPRRIKRSIDIKIIRNVLEDAFILDDIELKQVTIDELIRRMLIESRKK